jgi:hypothetical protein
MFRIPLLKTLQTQASRKKGGVREFRSEVVSHRNSVSKHTRALSPSHTHTAQGTQWGMQPRCHGDQKPSDGSLPQAHTHTQRGAVCSSPWPISLATVISPQSGLHYSLDSLLADGQVSCPIHSWPYQHGEDGHSVNTGLGFM